MKSVNENKVGEWVEDSFSHRVEFSLGTNP